MKKLKEAYASSKSAKVGCTCICPSCGRNFTKTSYQQAFCKALPGTQCKDKYWNTVDPKKRNNTTRISPASAAWMDKQQANRERYGMDAEWDDDPSWDAHKSR